MWMDDPLLDDLDEELDPKFSKFATIKKDKNGNRTQRSRIK